MKKFISIVLAVIISALLFSCQKTETPAKDSAINEAEIKLDLEDESQSSDEKLSVVTTLFPQYDFAKRIAGEKADVKLILPPGADSHSFEPTPADIIDITKSDLFIYTGQYMEMWADKVLDSLETEINVLNLSNGMELLKGDGHDHEAEHDHEKHDHEKHEHKHEFDPHIWTSPIIAIKIVNDITDQLSVIDPSNSDYYTNNADKIIADLKSIDDEIRETVTNGKRKDIYFGGHFALLYFTEEYGLTAHYAYESHADGTEPSIQGMSGMIDEMKENKIPVIFYEELTDPKVAKSISEETGAEMLLFHSCHNISTEDLKEDVSYVDIMYQNVENLKKGLM